ALLAEKLGPDHPHANLRPAAMAHAKLAQGRPAEALDWVNIALARNGNYSPSHWLRIAALVHLGRLDEARQAVAIFPAKEPRANLEGISRGQHARDPHRIAVVIDGLRKAGLPER